MKTAAGAAPRIFGFAVSPLGAEAIAAEITAQPPETGPRLVVTANIDHVRQLRRNAEFAAAYDSAAIVTCDGFPVYWYARIRGCPAPARVTGCAIAAALLRRRELSPRHRLFFVVDSVATATALQRWAADHGLAGRVAAAVPDFGFEQDAKAAAALAARIAAHRTTLLLMGVGAPKSEIFVHQHRAALPACWALCLGQALRIEVGLTRRAPSLVQRCHLEWLWRLAQEPRRLVGRYAAAGFGFAGAVARDLVRNREPT